MLLKAENVKRMGPAALELVVVGNTVLFSDAIPHGLVREAKVIRVTKTMIVTEWPRDIDNKLVVTRFSRACGHESGMQDCVRVNRLVTGDLVDKQEEPVDVSRNLAVKMDHRNLNVTKSWPAPGNARRLREALLNAEGVHTQLTGIHGLYKATDPNLEHRLRQVMERANVTRAMVKALYDSLMDEAPTERSLVSSIMDYAVSQHEPLKDLPWLGVAKPLLLDAVGEIIHRLTKERVKMLKDSAGERE